eukprot:10456177-Alexandrium_andersonii.AAC.1
MSASLVGSEMCIRDRCRTCADKPSQVQGASMLSVDTATKKRRGAVLAAVSYTHLTLPTICSV